MASPKAKTEDMGDSRAESKKGASNAPSFNMDELRELADLVDERGFTDFEFENEKIRVRLSKASTASPVMPPAAPAQAAAPQSSGGDVLPESTEDSDADDGLVKVTSPIVGTFYRSPAPDKPVYVKEGDTVSDDTVVCIVEAMKLMNEIQAEISGEIVKIYVENAQPVEYGQPLFGIRK
ncbi:MAG: acetyl-CoA carboxylase biotin carboxyl carrier protein [Acidobacteriota bacterium]|nr:acetyl-CoA carboxylase biotin carboxyl carrier protein [Acidobacteriota bacterium]MDH3530305.1 acetyl-CoA carboxylase biotin carboxyl carrier protein [Acidobacteriota bacterium]